MSINILACRQIQTRAVKLRQGQNVIRHSNPDLDVCRIGPKMWIPSLVSVSHFAKYRKNLPVIVWEMLVNRLKSHIPQWWIKWISDSECTCGSGSPPKVNHFQRVTSCPSLPCLVDVRSWVILLTEWHTHRQTDRQTDRQNDRSHYVASLGEVIVADHSKSTIHVPRNSVDLKSPDSGFAHYWAGHSEHQHSKHQPIKRWACKYLLHGSMVEL